VLLFLLGLSRYLYTYLMWHHFTNMSHLLMNSAVIVFMLGLIAEQIASLRLERGDKLFQPVTASSMRRSKSTPEAGGPEPAAEAKCADKELRVN
jgi:predicted ABC-type exoprotein transport system permease subunit